MDHYIREPSEYLWFLVKDPMVITTARYARKML